MPNCIEQLKLMTQHLDLGYQEYFKLFLVFDTRMQRLEAASSHDSTLIIVFYIHPMKRTWLLNP